MANPYELWNTRKSLGVMQETRSENRSYFRSMFTRVHLSEEEYVDFEKVPVENRKLAAFALPLGRGKGVYDASQKTFRVKPAYVILDDAIDPLKPLSFQPGLGESVFEMGSMKLTPKQKKELLKTQITGSHVRAWERRMEWLATRAIVDAQVTLSGPDYPTTLVNFGRDAGHTIALGVGARFGDAGVSILDFIKAQCDRMVAASFGGLPSRITTSGSVAGLIVKDAEIKAHMDINIKGGVHMVERGLLVGGENGELSYKFGEIFVGGASGRKIELWVNDEYYTNDAGVQTRYIANNEFVMTADAGRIEGFECFGRIVDEDADYQAIPLFPKNYTTGNAVKTEHIRHTSSPILVPVNPNATLKATVIA